MKVRKMQLATELPIETIGRFAQQAPIDVVGLAGELGIIVRFSPLGEISGKLIRAETPLGSWSGFVIFVNQNHTPRRQRFTTAHEIAHFVLHRDLIGDGITDDALYRSKLPDTYERQANRMAANILLPARIVGEEWRKGNRSVAGLADRFDVSEEAMRIRLAELRLSAHGSDLEPA
jgi:hypothetical protein